jgi:uncharacterized phage-associated protein
MASVHDVAAALIERQSPMDTWKLQKLAYYCQAWHLVWEGRPLFDSRIEAWAAGPVVRELYDFHRGRFLVSAWDQGDPARLEPSERATVSAVFDSYGDMTGRQLGQLTHQEEPWRRAREGLAPADRSNREIPLDDMFDFYNALDTSEDAVDVDELAWDLGDD